MLFDSPLLRTSALSVIFIARRNDWHLVSDFTAPPAAKSMADRSRKSWWCGAPPALFGSSINGCLWNGRCTADTAGARCRRALRLERRSVSGSAMSLLQSFYFAQVVAVPLNGLPNLLADHHNPLFAFAPPI